MAEKLIPLPLTGPKVMVRGGGDLATGVIQKLVHAGFRVLVTEVARPLTIRRTVALSTAVTAGFCQVEDIYGVHIAALEEAEELWQAGKVPVCVDPKASFLGKLQPIAVVDAILAKRNLGTTKEMAPIVIGMGPGFTAGVDVDVVIETMRGHSLGQLIFSGPALPNTGTPGLIGGRSKERVVHAPAAGIVQHIRQIGDVVMTGETIFMIGDVAVLSPLDGTLRGLISEGMDIPKGLKVADVDPRDPDVVDCFTISDKARALGGAVLEALLYLIRYHHLEK